MIELTEKLFHNVGPYVVQIAPALVVVFVVSFGVGWYCARQAKRR